MSETPVPFESLPPVLTPEQMQAADAETISSIGIDGFTLMEVAGRAVAEAALRYSGDIPARVTCFCGTGNNGGDGFVASRVLLERGMAVRVVLAGDEEKIVGDARKHYEILKKVGSDRDSFDLIGVLDEKGRHRELIESCVESTVELRIEQSGVIIDALIGTGLHDTVRGRIKFCIARINETSRPVVAVDIPSGLSGASGLILGDAVRAQETVVMAALKTGLLIEDGPSCSGKLNIAEIGIPESILRKTRKSDLSVRFMTEFYASSRRIERNRKSHKNTSGPTLVFAGSSDYTGAPVLAATAAARSGSGYVRCICPPSIYTLLAEKLTEIPVTPWIVSSDGKNAGEDVPDAKATCVLIGDHFQKCRAFLLGPGLGRSAGISNFLLSLLDAVAATPQNRAVIDADGIFAISEHRDRIKSLSDGRWILTPHVGEARVLERSNRTSSKQADSSLAGHHVIERVSHLANEWNCVVLLKGFPSVTAAPDGRVMINNSSLAASATAGTGDVLAGMIAGLAAQGLDAFDAAVCGVYHASKLAEEYVSSHSAESMMASDLLSLFTDRN